MNKQKFTLDKYMWGWWLRSSHSEYDYYVSFVSYDGSFYGLNCYNRGVAPTCIL